MKMNSQTASNWIQVATGLAVVIGVALVILELEQTKRIARAQLIAQDFALPRMVGEEPMDAVAKACESPDELSTKDLLDLRIYFFWEWNRFRYIRVTYPAAGMEMQWEPFARRSFSRIFETSVGRSWYVNVKQYMDVEAREIGDAVLANSGPVDCVGGLRRSLLG